MNGRTKYVVGLVLILAAAWILLDSVRMVSGIGWFGRHWYASSQLVVFVPFLAGVVGLFYNPRARWARWCAGLGLVFFVVEVVSGIHWWLFMKATHFLVLLVMVGAGLALILRSRRDT